MKIGMRLSWLMIVILTLLITLPILTFSQDDSEDLDLSYMEDADSGDVSDSDSAVDSASETAVDALEDKLFGLTGGVGSQVFGDGTYTSLSINPSFDFGFLAFGLRIPLYFRDIFNEDLPLRSKIKNYDEWNFGNDEGVWDGISDFLLKVAWLKLELDFDFMNMLLKLGNIKKFELGYGFLVDGFTNTSMAPSVQRLGMQLNMDFGYVGFETMFSDLRYEDLKTTGVRVFARPIYDMIPIFGNWEIGLTFITDLQPRGDRELAEVRTDITEDLMKNPSIFAFCINTGLPFLDNAIISMMFYSSFATQGHRFNDWENTLWGDDTRDDFKTLDNDNHYFSFSNWGIGSGVKGDIISMIPYRLEYRYIFDGFVPGFYDQFYEFERHQKAKLDSIIFSDTDAKYNGILFTTGFVLEEYGHVAVRFEHLFGKPWLEPEVVGDPDPVSDKNKLHMELSVYEGVIPRFNFIFAYDRKDIRSFDDFSDNFLSEHTMLTLQGNFEVMESIVVKVTWRRTFNKAFNELSGTYELKSDDTLEVGTDLTFF